MSLVAFYADCRHEVLKVTSGYRITLTYNLLLHGDRSRPDGDDGAVTELVEFLREHFSTPAPRYLSGPLADPPSRLVYLLDHEYTPRALHWSRLKGNDSSRVSLLRDAVPKAGCEAILALADVQETHDAYEGGRRGRSRRWYDDYDDADVDDAGSDAYEVHELINSAVTLTRWTGLDGAQLAEAAVVIWPRDRAFVNRAEISPGWALDELAAMASAGDIAAARSAAATLAPVWTGHWTDDALFGKALRAAEAVADVTIATLLLRPFRIASLTSGYASPFARLADGYGQDWMADQLRVWFGDDERGWAHGYSHEVEQWVTDRLPDLCRALPTRAGNSSVAAQQLIDLAWSRIRRSIGSAVAMSPPSYRASQLNGLGKPLAAVMAAASIVTAASTRDLVTAFIRQQDDAVTPLELSALRAAVDVPGSNAVANVGLSVLARDCADRLRARLARPIREADDWSIEAPASTCSCELCGTLDEFLAARDRRTLAWPLAKDGRQHVHSRIDRAELPVTHTTRRQGRPFTLVLAKTDALGTGELQARARDEADLAWIAGSWATASTSGNRR